MKDQEFRDWLSKRLWKGEPLTKKAMDTRVRRNQRARRFYESLAGRPSGTRDERMQGFLVPVSAYAWEEAAELAGRTVVRH